MYIRLQTHSNSLLISLKKLQTTKIDTKSGINSSFFIPPPIETMVTHSTRNIYEQTHTTIKVYVQTTTINRNYVSIHSTNLPVGNMDVEAVDYITQIYRIPHSTWR